MATVRELLKDSLMLIGVLAEGETPSADQAVEGLRALNRMIDSWSTESLMVYSKVREEFALVGTQAAYTMGTGGEFNTTRPQQLDSAAIILDGSELKLNVLTTEQWAAIRMKGTQSSIPTDLYYEPTYPTGTVYFYPVPDIQVTAVLYSWKPITRFASLDTEVLMPPGYEEAIVYNHALRTAPTYGKSPDALVVAIAGDSKANIERINSREMLLECDPAFLSGCGIANIFSGGSR